MINSSNPMGPKIWLMVGVVIAVALVILLVIYGGGSTSEQTGGY